MSQRKTRKPNASPVERNTGSAGLDQAAPTELGRFEIIGRMAEANLIPPHDVVKAVGRSVEISAHACPVCGSSRDGLRPTDPCPIDGHRLEDMS